MFGATQRRPSMGNRARAGRNIVDVTCPCQRLRVYCAVPADGGLLAGKQGSLAHEQAMGSHNLFNFPSELPRNNHRQKSYLSGSTTRTSPSPSGNPASYCYIH